MKQNYSVDAIFKEQLSEIDFPHKEKMWHQLEQKLEEEKAARKKGKRMAYTGLLLFFCFLLPSLKLADYHFQMKSPGANNINSRPVSDDLAVNSGSTQLKSNFIGSAMSAETIENQNSLVKALSSKNKIDLFGPSVSEEPTEEITDNILQKNEVSSFNILNTDLSIKTNGLLQNLLYPFLISDSKQGKKNAPFPEKKYSVAFEGGIDLFRKKEDIGFYGGMNVNKKVNERVSLSAGVNYSKNGLSMRYSIADKTPAQRQEIDAELHSLTMLRLPLQYRQSIPRSRLTVKAGLTPVYILNAKISNVPNYFRGNPAGYKEFTLKDINRFNVLFNAGINYAITPRISVEINGYYGLTDLVKDRYFNQSNVNDNLKNVQGGIAYRFN